jgi:signal peptidase I
VVKRWGRFEITERSMTPALNPGDRVVALARAPIRGSVIVFTAPSGMVMAKRVIGIPGDEVRIGGGAVRVNGVARTEVLSTAGGAAWDLGPSMFVVLSDARDLTVADSRSFGPIDASTIIGEVIWRYWPFSRIGRVEVS